jgi:predicted ATPase
MLETAEAVCADGEIESEEVFDSLSHLVNKSMVQVERQPGWETRYRMLEAIRQYASEKLSSSGERVALRSRHCTWFEQFVEISKPKL